MDLERTALIGVGVSYAFTTAAGQRAAVIIHLNRRHDIVVYDPEDRERVLHTLVLDPTESRAVAELLDRPVVMDQLTDLPRALDGVGAVRIPVPAGSPYDGRPLGDTRARARTGASIVAVVREGRVNPSPTPEFVLHHGDSVVVVGDDPAILAVRDLLTNG
jgi:TrkA domain protein